MKTYDLNTLYKQWCRETNRGGAVLVGGSIREFFEWLTQQGFYLERNEQV
jgi:hypothetical protein